MTTKNILYAAIGAGELAISKARTARASIDINSIRNELPKRLAKVQSTASEQATKVFLSGSKTYKGLVKRGEKTFREIRSSAPAKRALAQTKTARSETKAAVTSAKKAAETSVEAVKAAASE